MRFGRLYRCRSALYPAEGLPGTFAKQDVPIAQEHFEDRYCGGSIGTDIPQGLCRRDSDYRKTVASNLTNIGTRPLAGGPIRPSASRARAGQQIAALSHTQRSNRGLRADLSKGFQDFLSGVRPGFAISERLDENWNRRCCFWA